ncbi:GNAT family N-acetyltransferase [Flexithrix dorotheae]|uniref:GNAT family N-acetyltransferase n=1 Tax=Flexithrix dorotheae TaxID=70993 RepID=UPI00036F05E3|nr:GNAT family N-acetyltransferase [Flexithrix dorotheae]
MDNYELLKWDTRFFGFPVARIQDGLLIEEKLASVLENLSHQQIKLVYCATKSGIDQQCLIKSPYSGILVDWKITYKKSIEFVNEHDDHIQSFKHETDDEHILMQLAREAGRFSRFNKDPNIDKKVFQKLYSLWMQNSLNREGETQVLVYKTNNEIVGMVTLKIVGGVGVIDLIAVDTNFRGKGIGKKLLRAAETFFYRKTNQLKVVTQGENKKACSFYESFGFEVEEQVNFYHLWLK